MSTTVVVCGLVMAHIGTCLCYQSVNPRKVTFMIGYDTTREASTPQHTEVEGGTHPELLLLLRLLRWWDNLCLYWLGSVQGEGRE